MAPPRFVTSASLFDGHDAAITIMRRILQAQGAEVIHLGHDRSVDDIVRAALQEDADGVAVSSYQGGHVEFFTYLRGELNARGGGHIGVFGGGGGVILPEEIEQLASLDVRIYSPDDGQRLGLVGMIDDMMSGCSVRARPGAPSLDAIASGDEVALARHITATEAGQVRDDVAAAIAAIALEARVPVLGITGTGGSGKSSLTDEIVRRIRTRSGGKAKVAILAVDPTRSRGGGALLGDRIRMNAAADDGVYIRSLATRGTGPVPEALPQAIRACQAAGVDLVIVETPGIGQGDHAITEYVDLSLYVMTPEFGAATQLEKIDMLDYADVIAINKFERRGAEDALRDVSRQLLRNRGDFTARWEDMPVFGTSAARFADDGVSALVDHLLRELAPLGLSIDVPAAPQARTSTGLASVVPPARIRYLSEIAEVIREYHRTTEQQAHLAGEMQALATAAALLTSAEAAAEAETLAEQRRHDLLPEVAAALEEWPTVAAAARADDSLWRTTPSGNRIPRIGLPSSDDASGLVRYLRSENLPGRFPFTAGVFPLKRDTEMPTRMFAGEGDPARTNRRFHLLAEGQDATRLSVAFDSVTLYGRDPALRPDIYGKVGTSGVSVATLDDMRDLFAGFDLCDASTSVSMTINGPAPTILAMFLTTAMDQQRERAATLLGRPLTATEQEEIDVRTLERTTLNRTESVRACFAHRRFA